MDRYRIIKTIGDGTFGTVVQAEHIETGRLVAIKKMKKKYDTWEECLKLREVKALKQLAHPNLIRLHEVVREHRELHFIFEHLQQNLYQCIRHRRITRLSEVRDILKQCLQGLSYMHECGFVHRDIKPENILLSRIDVQNRIDGLVMHKWIVKLADLGLARPVPAPPEGPPLTQYVSTRWYRAPEVLLRCRDYELPIDVWAIGTVAAEICNGRPMFPGRGEPDQLARLAAVLGSPNDVSAPGGVWVKGVARARSMGLRFPKIQAAGLHMTLPGFDATLLDLIARTLRWDPHRRIACSQALAHPFFLSTLDRPLIVTASSVDTSTSISSLVTLAAQPQAPGSHKQSASAVDLPRASKERKHDRSASKPRLSMDSPTIPPVQPPGKSPERTLLEGKQAMPVVPPKRKRASLPPSVFYGRQEPFSNPTSPLPTDTPKSSETKQSHARTSENTGPVKRISLAHEASLIVDNEITLDNEYTSPDMLPQLELSVGVDPSGAFKGRKLKKNTEDKSMWSTFESLISRRSSKSSKGAQTSEGDEEKAGLFRMFTRSRSRSRVGKGTKSGEGKEEEEEKVVLDKQKSKSVPNVATAVAPQPVLSPKIMPDDVPSEQLDYWEQEDTKKKHKSTISLPRLFKRGQSRSKNKPETTANVKLTDVQSPTHPVAPRDARRGRDPSVVATSLAAKDSGEKKSFDLPRLVSLGKTLTRLDRSRGAKKAEKQPKSKSSATDEDAISPEPAEMNDTLSSLKDFGKVAVHADGLHEFDDATLRQKPDKIKARRATLNEPVSVAPPAPREARSKTVNEGKSSAARRAKSVGVEVSRTFQSLARRLRTPKSDEKQPEKAPQPAKDDEAKAATWKWRSSRGAHASAEQLVDKTGKRRTFFSTRKKTPPAPSTSTEQQPELMRHSVDTSIPQNPLVYHPDKSTKSLPAAIHEEASWNGTNSTRSFYLHPAEMLGTATPRTTSTSTSEHVEEEANRLLHDKKVSGIWV